MKRILFLFAFVFLIPFLSSASIEMKENYSQGETLIAKIAGNFVEPILDENVVFYRGHVEIPMNYEVSKIGTSFYVAAYLSSKQEGNYSLELKDIYYYQGSSISNETLIKNFSIDNKTADFYLDKGFVITENPFSIEVSGLKDYSVEVEITSSEEFISQETLTISSDESKKIDFSFNNITEEFIGEVTLSSKNTEYTVPIYFYGTIPDEGYCGDSIINSGEQCDGRNWGEVKDCSDFDFSDGDLKCVDCKFDTSECTEKVPDECDEDNDCEDDEECDKGECVRVEDECDDDNDCDDDEECDDGECVEIEPECTKDEHCTGGDVCVDEECVECENADDCENETNKCVNNFCVSYEAQKTCEELKGEFCAQENCKGEFRDIRGNICCLGSCEEKKSSASSAWIGWTLLILVVLVLAFFYIKYRRSKAKPVDFSKAFGR